MVLLNTSEEALEHFKSLKDDQTAAGLQQRSELPQHGDSLGSAPLQQV